MECLVVNKSSSCHGVLGRPALINLGTKTHTKFLCMKFFTDCRITTVIENQSESRPCYTNAIRKFIDREVNTIDVEMKEAPSDRERLNGRPKEEDDQMTKQEDPEDLDP
ncbi:Uncharacterized protein Adt_39703 [Abeliophyllum distichum]|uniref:Uncharacterized protein n=1 Tax=Abeliophyllum distichum TaxID=126358 RepID=A0ABD1Q5V4_9LAMI